MRETAKQFLRRRWLERTERTERAGRWITVAEFGLPIHDVLRWFPPGCQLARQQTDPGSVAGPFSGSVIEQTAPPPQRSETT